MALEFVSCQLCSSDNAERVITFDDFSYVQCRKCGLVYLNPRPSQKMLDDIYRQDGRILIDPRKDPTEGEELYFSRFSDKIKDIDRRREGKGKILDVGSAWGYFLTVAKKDGWDPYGVELSDLEGKYSKNRFNSNVFIGALSEAKFPDNHFDVVTLWHVLEHMPHPDRELAEIKRVLKKDGLLVIEVPDVRMLRDDVRQYRLNKIRLPWHLFYYNAATLCKLLKNAGFNIVQAEGCGNTRILTKLNHLNLHFITRFVIKYFSYFKNIKKFIQGLLRFLRRQENIIIYANK